jgi:predicted enzyme related to lactoylglutathione lyase
VLTPAMDTPFGRFAVVSDPWGAAFEVMQTQG